MRLLFNTVNQMFDGSSQLLTIVEHAAIKSLSTVLDDSGKLKKVTQNWIDGSEKCICRPGLNLNFLSLYVIERRYNGLAVLERFLF